MSDSAVAKLLQDHWYGNFERFYLSFIENHKRLANGEWSVKCPFHEDNKPSLALNMKNGHFNCFACGAQGNFIQFYMRIRGMDFLSATKQMCEEEGLTFPEKKQQKRKIAKTYDYVDAMGKLVFQAVRYEPKGFSQRRPGNGKWEWDLNGVKLVPYNLPKVLTSDRVLIMEGEKDCDKAQELGLTATTNPQGAGKWKDHFNVFLKNKEIILVPDNDKVGIEHMLSVGKSLQGVASVRWFDYPDNFNANKSDFTDFVNTFDNEFEAMSEVDKLIRAARKFDPAKIIIPEPDTELSNKIKEWIKLSPGEFSVKDIDYELSFQSAEDKIQRTKILEKFVAEKLLSREGKRRGVYRPFQTNLEMMDFVNADDRFLPVWLPFGLHKYVGLLPGNIVIIAGENNAGKTALMLNMVKANRNKFNVHYFNSEMGAGELKSRLQKFPDIGIDQWNFNAYHRNDNFSDVIFKGQNNINIIDFMEVHDEFYKIGQWIKDVHAALDGAIGVIAIQRNKGYEYGLGGGRTMEKARLVLNISPGKMEITKAKNFVDPTKNPNGLKCDFKLVNGCQFVMNCKDWYKEG